MIGVSHFECTKRWATTVISFCIVVTPPPLTELTSCRFKEPAAPFTHLNLFFSFWEPYVKNYDIQKQFHTKGKLVSDHACPGKGSEETWSKLMFTSLANTQHREPTIKNKSNKQNNNKRAKWEEKKNQSHW